uniref:Uncharacterized protein n=1 Tax=Oryzias latipes TaxID=8090 RepID=A0A3P9HWL6_ORYLA
METEAFSLLVFQFYSVKWSLHPHCLLLSVHGQLIKYLSTMLKITDKLYWKTWEGSLPDGAVSIWNSDCNRTDYVSKPSNRVECGLYTQSLGPYCYYTLSGRELKDPSFLILVNEDNFEDLVWINDSNGGVPKNAVRSADAVYVGKNQYGLGKVVPQHHCLFLPLKGRESWYRQYEVLTYNTDVKSDVLSCVEYQIDKAKIKHLPPETIKKSEISNITSTEITQSCTLEETTVDESNWDFTNSKGLHAEMKISTGIPSIFDMSITVGAEETFTYSKGGSRKKEKKWSQTLTVQVPPKQKRYITMVARKCKLEIPFTARLTRTYNKGKVGSTNISGTYRGACVSEVKTEVNQG